MKKEISNILTFDLENWYDSVFIFEKRKKDFIEEGVNKVLILLDKHDVKATFFVVGKILEKYPELIKKMHEKGHEIALHNYLHIPLKEINKEDFIKGIKISKKLIKNITKENPKGFRAPLWSLSKKEFWVYEVLEKMNFRYSSSLFPVDMKLYGDSNFPTTPFKPRREILEIPINPFKIFNLRIPFSGGVYFRLFPRSVIRKMIQKLNRNKERVVLYLHSWEFCPNIPRVESSLAGKICTYYNLKNNESKLDYILSNFKFTSFKNALENGAL